MKEENPARTTPQKTDDTLFFEPQLLGKEKCTYGPSFWCASKKNAELCGVSIPANFTMTVVPEPLPRLDGSEVSVSDS